MFLYNVKRNHEFFRVGRSIENCSDKHCRKLGTDEKGVFYVVITKSPMRYEAEALRHGFTGDEIRCLTKVS